MRRRGIIGALGFALLAALAPRVAAAQPAGVPLPLVGLLSPASATAAKANVDAFRQGLREAGLVEGQSVTVEFRFADGVHERLPGLVAELVALNPKVIVPGSFPGLLAASKATQTIPIVMVSAFADPVALGLAASLARPGGNVTGFAMAASSELYAKRLQLLKEAVPGIARVGMIFNPDDASDAAALASVKAAAPALGLTLELLAVRDRSELEAAFAAARERTEALYISQSPVFFTNRGDVVALANRHRLPAIYGFGEFVTIGGLLCYGVSLPDSYRRSAEYVARILKGERPSDMPIQQPTKFELVVNLKTADALGLAIPPSILLRADEVIE
jgi:putative tryptophan/tyrosine transport system substrate-binding protein